VKDVMGQFERSERQVERDLSFMRRSCDAPLSKNPATGRFEYEKPFDELGFLDEDALLLKVLLYKVAGANQFIPYNKSEFMRKIEKIVPERLKPLEAAIRYELPAFERADRARLSLFMNAINDKARVLIRYVDGSGRESERVAEPRRLLNYSGAWYCEPPRV
jgi:predicted DNA-binding transcriptional regulator YafY